jgi:glutathione-independent formaldehyde dehydrogenase
MTYYSYRNMLNSWLTTCEVHNELTTGQCPVINYNRQSMMAILHKVHIARAVNAAEAIPLEDAPRGYAELDSGAATKYVLNPDGYVAA